MRLKDLAKDLNLSIPTVSRALKNDPQISAKTRDKVQAYAREKNYVPNKVAQNLKNRKSNLIGVLIPEISHIFYTRILKGIEDFLLEKDYNMILHSSQELYTREKKVLQDLLRMNADGVIMVISKETAEFDHISDAITQGTPMVFLDRMCSSVKADYVLSDDFTGAYNATKHLIEKNRKNIYHFGTREDISVGKLRKAGYMQALKDCDIQIERNWSFSADNYDAGYHQMEDLIKSGNLPDGIFAVNDLAAAGAAKAALMNGMVIGRDIDIIGFSNEYAALTYPALDSVDQQAYQMGWRAGEVLFERIKTGIIDEFKVHIVKTKLVTRDKS